MQAPTKTTVYLDADDYRRLKALARAQGRSTAELVREAVSLYARANQPPPRPLSIGAGRSGDGSISVHAEALLDGMGEEQ